MWFWKEVIPCVLIVFIMGTFLMSAALLIEYFSSSRTSFMHIAVYHAQDRPLEPCIYRSFKSEKAFFDFLNEREIKDDEAMYYYFHLASNRRNTAYKFRRQYVELYPYYFKHMPPQDVWAIQDYWRDQR